MEGLNYNLKLRLITLSINSNVWKQQTYSVPRPVNLHPHSSSFVWFIFLIYSNLSELFSLWPLEGGREIMSLHEPASSQMGSLSPSLPLSLSFEQELFPVNTLEGRGSVYYENDLTEIRNLAA